MPRPSRCDGDTTCVLCRPPRAESAPRRSRGRRRLPPLRAARGCGIRPSSASHARARRPLLVDQASFATVEPGRVRACVPSCRCRRGCAAAACGGLSPPRVPARRRQPLAVPFRHAGLGLLEPGSDDLPQRVREREPFVDSDAPADRQDQRAASAEPAANKQPELGRQDATSRSQRSPDPHRLCFTPLVLVHRSIVAD